MRAALTARLVEDAALAALTGGRIHWNRQPPVSRVRPFVQLQQVGGAPHYTLSRGGRLRDALFQVDVWAADIATAVAIRARIVALLSGWRGLQSGVFVAGMVLDDERDLDSDTAGDVQELHGIALEFSAVWRE